jgi:tetratricopeptide (TPR) repeat protein
MIQIKCQDCGRVYKISDKYAGKTVLCAHCNGQIVVRTTCASNRTPKKSVGSENSDVLWDAIVDDIVADAPFTNAPIADIIVGAPSTDAPIDDNVADAASTNVPIVDIMVGAPSNNAPSGASTEIDCNTKNMPLQKISLPEGSDKWTYLRPGAVITILIPLLIITLKIFNSIPDGKAPAVHVAAKNAARPQPHIQPMQQKLPLIQLPQNQPKLTNIPPRLDGNFEHGLKALNKKDYDLAIMFFTAHIIIDPNEINAYFNRAFAYINKKEYDKAIEDYSQTIRLDPKRVDAYVNRGFAFSNKKEYDKAIEDYSQAIRLDPTHALGYRNRAFAYINKKEYDKAIEDYSQAILLNPKDIDAYINRGLAYINKKEYDKAIEDNSQAILLDSEQVNAYNNRGFAYFTKKEYEKAIQDYLHAIRLNPNEVNAHTNLAWVLGTCPKDEVRDGKKAVEHATLACNLGQWKNAYGLRSLAAACAENGNLKHAIMWQKEAIALGFGGNEDREIAYQQLKLYEKGKPYRGE